MVFRRPLHQPRLLGVDLGGAGTECVFRYRGLREFAKRLFCWNCDLASSSDKLCGRGLRWPKSGAWGAGFVWHFSGFGLTAFMGEIWRFSWDCASLFRASIEFSCAASRFDGVLGEDGGDERGRGGKLKR